MRRLYRMGSGTRGGLIFSDAAACLLEGALALVPTETVYGVGVAVAAFDSDDMPAEGSGYRRIFSLKQRELTQTVPWLVGGAEDILAYGRDVPEAALVLADAFWPGALTIVVSASAAVPAFMQAADGTVALRASGDATVRSLVRTCRSPLAVTSANTHGLPAPSAFSRAERRIVEGVDIAFDAGETACQQASTIVSCAGGAVRILRRGPITAEDLGSALCERGVEIAVREG